MLDAGGRRLFASCAPEVDEDAVKQAHRRRRRAGARRWPRPRRRRSARPADDWVIGSDSVVERRRTAFAKPRDRDEAADHLRFFSGRTMILSSAVALARDGMVEWSHVDSATLHVRALSDEFIDAYLDAEWPEVGYCVGVFRMEGRGVHLVRADRGRPFHHPRHAAAALARRACASGRAGGVTS